MTGVDLTRDAAADTALSITLDGKPPEDVWSELASGDALLDALARAARERLLKLMPDDAGHRQHPALLVDDGIDALGGAFATRVAGLVRADKVPRDAAAVVRAFGSGSERPLGFHQPLGVVSCGPAALFRSTSVTPPITVRVGEGFRTQRRSQRDIILDLMVTLADGCDVTLVADSVLTESWLREHHGSMLPGVSEQHTPGEDIPDPVGAAASELAPTGRPARTLSRIAETDAEERSYHTLYAAATARRLCVPPRRRVSLESVDRQRGYQPTRRTGYQTGRRPVVVPYREFLW